MIKNVQAVSVMYHGRKVGTLSMGNRSNCQFEYDNDWLSDGFSISPLQLPLKAGLFTADYQPFNGNFGVFEDSLPGGYGEYLLRKVLKKSGVDPQGLTPVQWLSIVGNSDFKGLPSDEDMITIGMNIRMSRERCQQIIEEVREGTRELKKYF